MTLEWTPTLGAWIDPNGTHFRVWAPEVRLIELVLEASPKRPLPMNKEADGYHVLHVPKMGAGTLYRYRVDGQGPFPDPASRFQPQGVHGPSEVIAPTFHWSDTDWMKRPVPESLIYYELHIGTFSEEGDFSGVEKKLSYLRDLGVTAVELMPIGDFPGERNWGYDGVSLFAPARCYGRPETLRRLVDAAHRLELAVFLDVVYNHFGPDGNYTGVYSPHYVTARHRTPWGDAINFDGPYSEYVRRFFIENALHWLHEYHLDGFRLDATHAILDDGPKHFLNELAECVHSSLPHRQIRLIAEDHRNWAHMVRPYDEGGWGLDGIWADDFHHEMRRLLAGDHEGYYRDYRGTVEDLATTIRQGWLFTGQHSDHLNEPRGTDPSELSPTAFVLCLQNHDQVGNRAFGERLHHEIDAASYRAATVLLLCSPQTPLLFMGQEWACSSPFRFFTDHHDELGRNVTEGRRREFRHFSAFADPQKRERIPDPQLRDTFTSSRLNWQEREDETHRGIWQLYRSLLRLRSEEPALKKPDSFEVVAVKEAGLVLSRRPLNGPGITLVCWFRGTGTVPCVPLLSEASNVLLSTEDLDFCIDPLPIELAKGEIRFHRPGAVLLRT